MEVRDKLKLIFKDYSVEEILELGDLEPVEALYLLITYGALDLENVIEGTDKAEN